MGDRSAVDAVRFAEAQIPAGSPGSASAKAKLALDYVLKLDHPVSDANVSAIKRALEAAHSAEFGSGPALTPPSPAPGKDQAPASPVVVISEGKA